MSNRFTENRRNEFINKVNERMATASRAMESFNEAVFNTAANWAGYQATSPPMEELMGSAAEFAEMARTLVDARKVGLAQALDIIAGGMKDENGDPLTRQDLLDELAGV